MADQAGIVGRQPQDLRARLGFQSSARRGRPLETDWSLLAGELLPDWSEDWVIVERERHRQLGLHALEALAERLIAARRLGPALEVALAAVAGEPLRESAHRLLIKVHIAEGNVGEAIRQYSFYREMLCDQLALPSAEMQALVDRLPVRSAR